MSFGEKTFCELSLADLGELLKDSKWDFFYDSKTKEKYFILSDNCSADIFASHFSKLFELLVSDYKFYPHGDSGLAKGTEYGIVELTRKCVKSERIIPDSHIVGSQFRELANGPFYRHYYSPIFKFPDTVPVSDVRTYLHAIVAKERIKGIDRELTSEDIKWQQEGLKKVEERMEKASKLNSTPNKYLDREANV